jgi:hypothetical protein
LDLLESGKFLGQKDELEVEKTRTLLYDKVAKQALGSGELPMLRFINSGLAGFQKCFHRQKTW